MEIPEFIATHYKPEPGSAMPVNSIVNALREIDVPADSVRRYIESRFQIGRACGDGILVGCHFCIWQGAASLCWQSRGNLSYRSEASYSRAT